MRIRYYCHYGATGGYGRAARDYLLALARVDGVQLEIGVFGEQLTSPEPRYRYLDRFARPYHAVEGGADVEVVHAQPRFLARINDVLHLPNATELVPRAAITTWETSSMPREYREPLFRDFARVIVPSNFCCDVIGLEHGAADMKVVPHCFDPEFWSAANPILDRTPAPSTVTKFLSIGAWGDRKNQLGVLKAYLGEFTKADRVELTMWIPRADFNQIHALVAAAGVAADELPAVTIPDATVELSEEELLSLYARHHCFVSATRGEGWGLGLFEAAIMGLAVVSPLYGGQFDFLNDYTALFHVPHVNTPCFGSPRTAAQSADGTMWRQQIIDKPPGMTCRQRWAEPDLATMGLLMRKVHGLRSSGAPLHSSAGGDRHDLEKMFSYATVGPILYKALQEIT